MALSSRGASGAVSHVLREQRLENGVEPTAARLPLVHLPDGALADAAALVDHVEGRPVLVAESLPVGIVVVEKMGEGQPVLADVRGHGLAPALVLELGGVDPHGGEPPRGEACEGVPDPGNRADAVDSAEGPDVEEDDAAPQLLEANGAAHPALGILMGERRGFQGVAAVRGLSSEQEDGARDQDRQRTAGAERGAHPLSYRENRLGGIGHSREWPSFSRRFLQGIVMEVRVMSLRFAVTSAVRLGTAFGVLVSSASAAEPIYTKDGLALSGYDAVAYFTQSKAVKGEPEFEHEWEGVRWRFASAANREAFALSPAKYAPQYGGYCAYAVSRDYTYATDPEAWKVVDGKLYLNYDKKVRTLWEKELPEAISRADRNWPAVLAKPKR
jgi:hypothetical protein